MKNNQKKEIAKMLFLKGNISQKEIAKRVDTTEKTLSKWAKEEKWNELRTITAATKQEQLKSMYAQLEELNKVIASREEGQRYASSKEADTINKLNASIRILQNETPATSIIEIMMQFIEFAHSQEFKYTEDLMELSNTFIKRNL